jgi:hypothetical protein
MVTDLETNFNRLQLPYQTGIKLPILTGQDIP